MCQNIFPPKMGTIHPFKDDETVTKALHIYFITKTIQINSTALNYKIYIL